MENTDYVIRAVKPAGRNRVTVTFVDMAGQVRQVTMTKRTFDFDGRDRLIRAVIAKHQPIHIDHGGP